ncbi:MAG: 2-oxoacid:ferredoxin oxidoreductase subunit beta [Planctomycetes bacterium]|nr:2-oxoacid:ferredoxin oxidoreductase subunit beta [Planctomycetota bacterium]NBY02233.1 2-oxoacid:ferredoxin oxidoreductase subunit beta [Planctomycetota bacterium]
MITHNQPTDFASEQEVRWCPGCGDYAILAQLKKTLSDMPILKEQQVFLSGIGCASRMPNYLSTYGFRGLHGGAVSSAMGLKLAQPNLTVWIVLGDGEGFGAATQHLLHACRRNVDIKVLFINNEIRGLSRGQESATTRPGTLTATCPEGSTDNPWHPCALALAAGATFVARSLDVDVDHLGNILQRASAHKGFAFVEILQNCKVYNDLVFDNLATQHDRPEHLIYLEHGKPMVYGAQGRQGIKFENASVSIVQLNQGGDQTPAIHDEAGESSFAAQMLATLENPDFPECIGVFRAVTRICHHESFYQGTRTPSPEIPTLDLQGPDSFPVE